MPLPHPPVPLGPKLGPGPKQREVDVEQDSLQHAIEDNPEADGNAALHRRRRAQPAGRHAAEGM